MYTLNSVIQLKHFNPTLNFNADNITHFNLYSPVIQLKHFNPTLSSNPDHITHFNLYNP